MSRDTDACDALADICRRGEEPPPDTISAVFDLLRLWLARRGLEPDELQEVSGESVRRLINAARRGKLDPRRPAGAWLRVVADHVAVDVLRRRPPATVAFDDSHHAFREDDHLAAMLDVEAAGQSVRAALRDAVEEGDENVAKVIVTWLGLASMDGEPPSSRAVGERLGVSHATVQRALAAFGRRLSGV